LKIFFLYYLKNLGTSSVCWSHTEMSASILEIILES
jgi:hypothetical protein